MLMLTRFASTRHFLGWNQRAYSTSTFNNAAVDAWISQPQQVVRSDVLRAEHLLDLHFTLPTRDGTRRPLEPPISSTPLGYGHHLVFLHGRTPESQLREDGTDPEFCAPEPFTRRMWGGGKMTWDNDNPLLVGESVTATSSLSSVKKKGFDDPTKRPMLVVTQKTHIHMPMRTQSSVCEERYHVYFSDTVNAKQEIRTVKDIPPKADFSFTYTPSLTTLFRFSALTFNAHLIHLDQQFSQVKQGYPERLVHGPLTAMMFLETVVFHNPNVRLKSFEYRATNPIIVNRRSTICGAWKSNAAITLWCVDDNGHVGMTGSVIVA